MNITSDLQHALKSASKEKINQVFEKIYSNYFNLGMFIALQYLNEHDAIEVTEDVFVLFFEKILKERRCEINNIKQYLCASIKNSSLSKIKELKSILPYYNDINYQKEDEPIYLIETLFAGLNKEEQYIINEHIVLDKTFNEIANDLNRPLNSIKSIYRRAVIKARRKHSWIKREL